MSVVRTTDGAVVYTSDGAIVRTSDAFDEVEIECSISITAPAPIPSIGIQQWRLHQFTIKARYEQTS